MRSTAAGRCLCVALIVCASAARAQPASPVIRGRIVADDNDRPLRRALVAIERFGDNAVRPVLTDDEGRFEIRPPDASASLTVTKAGYATARIALPSRSRNAAPELVVRMPRGGVISGRVLDSNGETAVGVKVTARLDGATGDGRTFDGEADDLGEYRISGLPAGRYVVSQAATGTRVLTTVEYTLLEQSLKQGRRFQDVLLEPSGPSRSLDVRSGEETGNIDFEVPVSHTIRSLVPVMGQMQITAPPGQVPGSILSRSNNPASIVIGPPQAQLQGGRVLNVFGYEGPRSLDLRLSDGASISGTIVDAAGEPFQGVSVRALQVRHENGRAVARGIAWPRVTDDRGRYRLFGLAPGSYLIVATLNAIEFTSGRPSTAGLTPLYFPGTAHLDAAQMLPVEVGSDLIGTDLTYTVSPVVRLTGKALDFMGRPLVGRVSLGISQRSAPITTDPRVVRTGSEGSFVFTDVTPGDYIVQATAEAGFGGPAEFGSEYVTVADRDPPPIVVPTSRGATLEGRFVVDGAADAPMRAYSLRAAPQNPDRSPPGNRGPAIHDDGRFYVTGLHGSMRLTSPNTLPGWYVKWVTIGGVDVTDVPFDFGHDEKTMTDAQIVLSSTAASIAGSIENEPGTRPPASTVIAFSTNREQWFDGSRHVKRIASDSQGSFNVTGLPPGEYFVAAVDASTSLDLQAPSTLESLVPRAVRVTAREGTVSTVDLGFVRR